MVDDLKETVFCSHNETDAHVNYHRECVAHTTPAQIQANRIPELRWESRQP